MNIKYLRFLIPLSLLIFLIMPIESMAVKPLIHTPASPKRVIHNPPSPKPEVHNPMIHSEGRRLVDGHGNDIKLRGVFLDNWLFWTGSAWGAGLVSETHILDTLKKVIGEEETTKFQERVYREFCDETTFARIKKLGFNCVRIPFNHRLIEDDENPFVYKEKGFAHLDRALGLCEKFGIYAILDLHSAPGGQSNLFVADPGPENLWQHPRNRERTVALWKAIAQRYKSRKIVAGYDLLNEPGDCKGKHLVLIYERIIKAIREVDPYHSVFLEGLNCSMDFSPFDRKLDDNQVYAFHTYWLFPFTLLIQDQKGKLVKDLVALGTKHDCPVLNTEFGAQTAQWTGDCVSLFEKPENKVCGWVFWPWKRTPEVGVKYRHLAGIQAPDSWMKLMRWISLPLWGKPSKEEALKAMDDFFFAASDKNTVMDEEMLSKLIR